MNLRPCWHCATPHQSDTVPALCSDPCREVWRGLYQLAYAEPSEILDGPIHPGEIRTVVSASSAQILVGDTWQDLPGVHSVELGPIDGPPRHTNHGCNPQAVIEIEPTALAEHDQAVLDAWTTDYPSTVPFINNLSITAQRELAQQLRPVTAPGGFARARDQILGLHDVGNLGYLAASDEWIDHHGEPLATPLQHVADRLARDGHLPEFAEWFPRPPEPPPARPHPKPRPPWWKRRSGRV